MINPRSLDAVFLNKALQDLILEEVDLNAPRHVELTRLLNELSGIGLPPLVESARHLLGGDQTWMSSPLRSALQRVCSHPPENLPTLSRRYPPQEEDHLFDQLKAILIDLELMTSTRKSSGLEGLRESLLIASAQWLITEAEAHRDLHLWRLLVELSATLGELLEVDVERFHQEAMSILTSAFRECNHAGGALHIILPGRSDTALITQLEQSGLLSDIRGVEALSLEGYDALEWLSKINTGLESVHSISVTVLTEGELLSIEEERLLTQLKRGLDGRPARGALSSTLLQALQHRGDETLLMIAERVSAEVITRVGELELPLIYIPRGEFWMGEKDEDNEHRRAITEPLLMGKTPVTQDIWAATMHATSYPDPSDSKGSRLPVDSVSWFQCLHFCNLLSEAQGLSATYDVRDGSEVQNVQASLNSSGFRLPSEIEWEYAATAGMRYEYAGSDQPEEVAWFYQNAPDEKSQPVALLRPNDWGLYDMCGNINEWCSGPFDPEGFEDLKGTSYGVEPWASASEFRSYRGGSYDYSNHHGKVSTLNRCVPEEGTYNIGFRVSRSVQF